MSDINERFANIFEEIARDKPASESPAPESAQEPAPAPEPEEERARERAARAIEVERAQAERIAQGERERAERLASVPLSRGAERRLAEVREETRIEAAQIAQIGADVVLGAEEGAPGHKYEWKGSGERTRAELIAHLVEAGLPSGWAPTGRGAAGALGDAMRVANCNGYVARSTTKLEAQRETGTLAKWITRWTVHRHNGRADVDQSAGNVLLTVELYEDGLKFVASAAAPGAARSLERLISDEYNRVTAADVYKAAQVTDWLERVLRYRFGGVDLGLGIYVPKAQRAPAERLCESIARSWGRRWAIAIPVATSAQLARGLGRGLASEVDQVRQSLAKDFGERAALSALEKLEGIAVRAQAYGAILTDEGIAIVVREAKNLIETLRGTINTTSIRGAAIWDEIGRDLPEAPPVLAPSACRPVAPLPKIEAPPVAPVAPAPPVVEERFAEVPDVQPYRLKEGGWGARSRLSVRVGDVVRIVARSGKAWPARVSEVLGTHKGLTYFKTENLPRA